LVSLFQPSFWKRGGRFEMARRLAAVGASLAVVVNILPFRNDGGADQVLLGYEYWHLWGIIAAGGLIYWITMRQPGLAGGFFSWPLSLIVSGVALALLVAGAAGWISDPGDGYYVLVVGLIMTAAAGMIPYHADQQPEVAG
jgi:hypothetical protein